MAKEKLASTVLWRIVDIGSLNSENIKTGICSPDILLNNLGENEWKPRFLRNDQGRLDISLRPSRFVESVSISCEWALLDADGLTTFEHITEYEITSDESCHYMLSSLRERDIMLDEDALFLSCDTLYVRLRVRKSNEDSTQTEHVSVVTRLVQKSHKAQFMWIIENISTLPLDTEAVATVNLRGHAFRMKFFFTGESLDEAHVNFGVSTENGPKLDLKMSLCFSNTLAMYRAKKHTFCSSVRAQTWIVPKLMSRLQLLQIPNIHINRDKLTIHCEFTCDFKTSVRSFIEGYYCGPDEQLRVDSEDNSVVGKDSEQFQIISTISEGKVQTTHRGRSPKDESQLKKESVSALFDDIVSLYKDQILTDFELRSEGKSFHVHKNILSARSPVFRAMFCGDMKEASSQFLEVPDVDYCTLGLFLAFLYSGIWTESTWVTAAKLYYAADKYQVLTLKQECSSNLRSNMGLSNVIEILELADRHEDILLKSFATDFIENNFDAVVLSEEWDEFQERNILAGKIMKEAYKKRKCIQSW